MDIFTVFGINFLEVFVGVGSTLGLLWVGIYIGKNHGSFEKFTLCLLDYFIKENHIPEEQLPLYEDSCVCRGTGFYDNGYHILSYCHLCRQGEIERLKAGK